MSGVIKITNTKTWVKTGDVYDGILKRMADLLPSENADLRSLLMNSRTDKSVGYCDLSKLDDARFIRIVQAAVAAHLQLIAAGPESFALPEYYPGYVKQVENLLDMLKTDPRAGKLAS